MVTIATIEENLARYRYTKPNGGANEADRIILPLVSDAYEMLCRLFRTRIPTQDEVIRYLQPKDENEANRVRRAYPSIVRDHHLYLLLKDSFPFVLRTKELDIEYGIDFLIVEASLAFCVHAFVDTFEAKAWREQKEKRHPYTGGVHIDLPLDLDRAKVVGDFRLYDNGYIENLRKIIKTYVSSLKRAGG